MTTNSTNDKPIKKIFDAGVTAAIWRNEGKNGTFYSVTLTRSYKDDNGEYKDTGSFSGSELLHVQRVAGIAYTEINALRRADRDAAKEAEALT